MSWFLGDLIGPGSFKGKRYYFSILTGKLHDHFPHATQYKLTRFHIELLQEQEDEPHVFVVHS